ncbi:hypothetical protein GCK72_020478 [Caenorhabditis remanei]|uniref:Uncharacterized protein n=1 Tax=Caenorhabditis remanei TaxID=31234 RepID=A0A6A5GH31_CAERE|nr:hypothetical protein GCK72_020478 [Caenorhabditis remanei]KAF1753921.1 hypothetical protein GCK72_020478 [Caenorhabditis remanei]
MILNWNPTQLNFDPLFIIISAAPLPMNLKFSATITIGIALSRNTAVCFPGLFRRMEQRYYSEIVGLIAGVLGLVDAVLSITLSPVVQIANCGTTGCFVGSSFLFYWGISNMFLGLVVIALSASLLLKMKDIDGKSSTASVTGSQKSKFQQANKTATGVLISSLIFFTIPSLFVGIVQLIGISFFKLIGPFYYTSLLLSGIFSGIVFLISNNDARRVIAGQPTNHSTQVTSIFVKRVAGT